MSVSNSGDRASEKQASFLDLFGRIFTSVRLALFLLFALAIASILGTVIPQESAFQQFSGAQDSLYSRLALILDLHQIYRSWWFLLLLVLLCLNLFGCLNKRIPQLIADWKGKRLKETFVVSLLDRRNTEASKHALIAAIGRVMGSLPKTEEEPGVCRLEWMRHRLHLLGFPLIHVAIIIVLLGALIGLLYGFKGAVQIREGSSESQYTLIPSGQTATLPFEVALDRFELSHYPSGEPKEYRSDVRLIQNGKEVYKGSIRVNHPITYDGISLFQSDYKLVSVKGVTLGLEDQSGSKHELLIEPGIETNFPGGLFNVRLVALDPGSTIRGPWIELAVEKESEGNQKVRIFQKESRPVRIGDYEVRFKSYEPLYASGLQIGYDPGSYLVWLGCIILMVGFVITLFTNYRHVSILLVADGPEKTRLRVSGSSRRLRREFRETIEKVTKSAVESVER